MSVNREQLLREMGLGPVWRLRQPVATDAVDASVTGAVSAALPEADSLERKTASAIPASPLPARDLRPEAVAAPVSGLDWDALETQIRGCTACGLCRGRRQAVPGVGDRHADWLFVGEGPGAEEDERGEPFVGQAGKLLDNMLAAIGLKRGHDVYIANAVKCRPPGNRTPEADETAACRPYLQRQIDLLQPRLIVALGRPAAQTLLQAEVKIGTARGTLHRYGEIPVIVTYHPAYLLRNLPDKAQAWEDLVFMRRTMAGLKPAG